MRHFLGFIVGLLLVAYASLASADLSIVDIAFATDVQQREPVAIFDPPGSCASPDSPSAQKPVIDSQQYTKVFLWTTVNAAEAATLQHTWYKAEEGSDAHTEWAQVASTELRVGPSHSWRTWSSKTISPDLHKGEWKVHITTTTNPDNVLCEAHFKVE
jgi:hypothetical protein